MFSISTTFVQLVAVFAAIATPSFGATVKRECWKSGHLYLGQIKGVDNYISSPQNYLGNNIFMPVVKADAAEFRWNKCTTDGGSNIGVKVSILWLE